MTTVKIAVSSRALFDLEEEHQVFENEGIGAYVRIHQERENKPLEEGTAYSFIKVLQNVNEQLANIGSSSKFKVVLLSHNHGGTAKRLINSIIENKLPIKQMGLTDGENPIKYMPGFGIDLFLTLYGNEVGDALKKGYAAALMSTQKDINSPPEDQLRIAFDLDAVLFGDEAEKEYQRLKATDPETALQKYEAQQLASADTPLSEGPLKKFAMAIGNIQKEFSENTKNMKPVPKSPIRTYIVTARGVVSGKRVLTTLEAWNLTINETFFLDGQSKDGVLKEIRPHIFFDDTSKNIEDAKKVGVPAGHITGI